MRNLLRLPVCALLISIAASAVAQRIVDLSTTFDYFANSWGVVGLKDYPNGCRITPDWRLQLADGIEARWLLGADETPLPRGVRRALPGGLPLPESRVLYDGAVEYRLRVFAVPMWGRPWDYRRRTVDGDNFAVVAWARATNVSGKPQRPRVAMRLERDGQPLQLSEAERRRGTLLGTAGEEPLAPGTYADALLWLTYRGAVPTTEDRLVSGGPPDPELYEMARDYWARLLRTGSPRIVIPEPKVRDTYFASLAYTFIGRDDGHVHAGEGFYDGFFLRDGAYQVWALEAAGYLDEARPSALDFVKYQKANGQFESQGGELDGNGQALWTLVRHYEMTHDEAYLRQVYPAIRRSMAWLTQALQRDPSDADAAFAGVLPKSWADGEALSKSDYHVVGYDFWNLRGTLCAVRAAEALGETADAEQWRRLADGYRAAIARLAKASGARDFPPSLELAGTDWGNLTGIYPTRLFPPFDPRVSATFAEARRTFVEGTIRWCPETRQTIHPYRSTYLTNSYIIRGEYDKAVAGLYAMLLHTTSDHGFPEGVYYRTRTAWGDTVPHLWAAAQYCLLLRNMLLREDGCDLHLASAVPTHWLAPGETVAFEDMPTTFGRAGFRLLAERECLRVQIDAPAGGSLRRVVFHTPPSIRILGATARTGRLVATRDHEIALSPGRAYVDVRIARGPYERRDYASTVARYLKGQSRTRPQFTAVLGWPLEVPVDASRCVPLDLRPAANVDPFTAPFGTLNPGKYLFTGLSTGRVEAQGVPLEVIDPATNEQRAFVVLQGSQTSSDFPRSVEIPVNLQGTRAFFLGQVTGWSPGDPGDPKTGAIGEYVLEYADGKRQTVPLVSQATVDDWAMAPTASLTQLGLQGDPWHLSVLAVRLRAEKLTQIVFKDNGTPAAPLLAAITIEQ
jgi:hypothetical protein